MLRSLMFMVGLLNFIAASSWAADALPMLVVVPDSNLAAEVAERMPGIRIAVLQLHVDEPDSVVNARAIACQHATMLLFDHASESPRLAMFRERLEMQGVIAFNIRPTYPSRQKRLRPAVLSNLDQLALLQVPRSNPIK